MAELLQTERTYVKDLETCIRVWFHSFHCDFIWMYSYQSVWLLFRNYPGWANSVWI